MARSRKAQPASLPAAELEAEVARIAALGIDQLRAEWQVIFRTSTPSALSKDLIARTLAHRLQEKTYGALPSRTLRVLRDLAIDGATEPRPVKAGSVIVREYAGVLHEVLVVPGGFVWQDRRYDSLSTIAKAITGTTWNGPRFFGLRSKRDSSTVEVAGPAAASPRASRVGRRSSVGAAAALASDTGRRTSAEGAGRPQQAFGTVRSAAPVSDSVAGIAP